MYTSDVPLDLKNHFSHFHDSIFYVSYRTQGPAGDTIFTFSKRSDRSIPWRSPLLPLKRSLATRTRSIPWRSPLLPLKRSFATYLSAILPADLAFLHDRSIERGRGHNVCGGISTLKSASARNQISTEFVVPSGTKEEDSKFF